MLGAEQNLRRAVPQGHHLVRVGFDWEAKGSSKAKISQFDDFSIRTNQKVLWFEISMENPVGMEEDKGLQDLEQEALALLCW